MPDHLTITTAWDLIGFDGNWDDKPADVRVVGGRTRYEAVGFSDSTRGDRVRLTRADFSDGNMRAVVRYVDADTRLEVVPV